ncbi:SsrA-binding protein SmpB [Waddlia chondrophila]|nr:SsrA-binding protein SmpB [Waddlia chondrophila]
MGKKSSSSELVSNRKARHSYEILDTYEAGIALTGTEVKSLRDNGGSLQEAYIRVKGGELWLLKCHIAPWKYGNIHNHEETRERKLLMHKKEIQRLKAATQEKGLTIVPLALYLKNGKIKVSLAAAKGKTGLDKRKSLKEKDEKRRMQQAMKRDVSH